MIKIPTLFERDNNHIARNEIKPGFKWVLDGDGLATIKWDGSCCAIIDGTFYKRYDAKNKKKLPDGAIACQPNPDPITGHWPHWVPISKDNPGDKWFIEAYKNTTEFMIESIFSDGIFLTPIDNITYEAVGPHFQGNPYQLNKDILIGHGFDIVNLPDRSFEGIKEFLRLTSIEGIVFWKDGIPQCKIKRKDFGLDWPVKT